MSSHDGNSLIISKSKFLRKISHYLSKVIMSTWKLVLISCIRSRIAILSAIFEGRKRTNPGFKGSFNNYVDKKGGQPKVHACPPGGPLNVHMDPNIAFSERISYHFAL